MIVLAGAGILLLALIIFAVSGATSDPQSATTRSYDLDSIPAVSNTDNTRGPGNAAVKLVEYSDIECPFCQEYHNELLDLVERDPLANFSWTYRHFPLPIHNNARDYAVATECAADQDGFWEYLDTLTNRVRNDEDFDDAGLIELATDINLDTNRFAACLDDDAAADRVDTDLADGRSAGITGTPFSLFEFDRQINDEELETIQGLFGSSTAIVTASDNRRLAIGGVIGATQIREIVQLIVDPAADEVVVPISEGTE